FGFYFLTSAFFRWKSLTTTTPLGLDKIEHLLNKVPFVGDVSYYKAVWEFSLLFATQLNSGISILESLKTMSTLLSNSSYRTACFQMYEAILNGDTLSLAGQKTSVWKYTMLQELTHGEQTGMLSEIMFKQAERARERYLELVVMYSKWLSYIIYGLVVSYVVNEIAFVL
ncbi:MAG: hypothetical protein CMK59_14210, partial [Proteobacteria bacterium]|nr:hypothetical protein [Pseudomonadota bacterium]